MATERSAEQLYYSPQALDRFTELEGMTRRRQLGHFRTIDLPGIAANEEFIRASGDATIMSPLFGAWLDRAIQTQEFAEDDKYLKETLRRVFYIGNYAATAALATDQEKEMLVLPHRGHIVIPEVGRIAVAATDGTFVQVQVAHGITVEANGTSVHIAHADMAEATPTWQPLRYIGPPDFQVALNDIDPNRDIFRYPVADHLSDAEYARWHTTFSDAWDFIQEHDPHMARIVRATLTTIVPAPTEPLTHGKSMAAGAAFGVIGINEHRDPERLASHIVYGMRKHLAIALRNEFPDMYLPEEDSRATKPVYPPSREGHGIAPHLLDDSFINIGLARFFAEVSRSARPNVRSYAQLSFARWFVESQQNVQSLRASGYVNAGNTEIVAALEQELGALTGHYEHVPEHLQQAIATNVLDRAISWRLHNSVPQAGSVQFLRDTWLRGESCPSLTVPGELSRSIDAYTHIGQRTRYVLKESSIKDPALFAALHQGKPDPQRFGTPTPGDIAFARGDLREARNYFVTAIQSQPRDPEPWAGFALTYEHDNSAAAQALLQAPELVAAVYAAVGDPHVHPAELAAWVANCRVITAIDDKN